MFSRISSLVAGFIHRRSENEEESPLVTPDEHDFPLLDYLPENKKLVLLILRKLSPHDLIHFAMCSPSTLELARESRMESVENKGPIVVNLCFHFDSQRISMNYLDDPRTHYEYNIKQLAALPRSYFNYNGLLFENGSSLIGDEEDEDNIYQNIIHFHNTHTAMKIVYDLICRIYPSAISKITVELRENSFERVERIITSFQEYNTAEWIFVNFSIRNEILRKLHVEISKVNLEKVVIRCNSNSKFRCDFEDLKCKVYLNNHAQWADMDQICIMKIQHVYLYDTKIQCANFCKFAEDWKKGFTPPWCSLILESSYCKKASLKDYIDMPYLEITNFGNKEIFIKNPTIRCFKFQTANMEGYHIMREDGEIATFAIEHGGYFTFHLQNEENLTIIPRCLLPTKKQRTARRTLF